MPNRRSYLFSRRGYDWEATDPISLAHTVFFQMWRTRSYPYNVFDEGDAVYIGDTATRRVHYQVRVTSLLTDFNYTSTRHALSALRSAYGMYSADLNDYHRSRSGRGWLLAWAPQVMRQLDVTLPDGQHFGQNGYRELSTEDIEACGLPMPKRSHPIASSMNTYAPSAARTGVTPNPTRYVPVHVSHEVWERDGGRCVNCRKSSGLHLDHIVPFAHGGPSTTDNLRLICAKSNLSRGAGDPSGPLKCKKNEFA